MKSKKLLWMLVMVVLVVSSVMVEGGIVDGLRNFGGNLKSTFSSGGRFLPVIVNTIILTLIIYFALHLLEFKMEGKKAPLIVLGVVAVLSLMIARNVYGIKYIWRLENFFRDALNIITDPTRIGVLMGSALLLWWLFNELKIGKEGFEQKLNIIMAVLIGFNLARGDVSPATIVKLGEIIAIWVFYRNLQAGGVERKWLVLGGASLLVFYISSIAFKGMGIMTFTTLKGTIWWTVRQIIIIGTQLVIMLGIYYGITKGVGDRGGDRFKFGIKIGAGAVAIAITFAFFTFISKYVPGFKNVFGEVGLFSFRSWITLIGFIFAFVVISAGLGKAGKEDEKEEKIGRWRKVALSYALDEIQKKMGRSNSKLIRAIYRLIDPKRKTPENEASPFTFRDLRVELITLMNYMLRLQVYLEKSSSVTKVGETLKTDLYSPKGLNSIFEIERIQKGLDDLKNGGGYRVVNGKEIQSIPVVGERGESVPVGFLCTEWVILQLFNALIKELETLEHKGELAEDDAIKTSRDEKVDETFKAVKGERVRQGSINWGEIKGHFQRRSAYNIVESKRLHYLDQKRKTGKYNHTYKFARKGAPTEVWEVSGSIDTGNSKFKRIDSYNKIGDGNNVDKEFKYEVDANGFYLEDINNFKFRNGSNRIRRVKAYSEKIGADDEPDIVNSNIVDHKMFTDVIAALGTEWDMFIRDVRSGKFHPHSRGAKDYEVLHDKRCYNYTGLTKGFGECKEGNPAFDREALKQACFLYWGREKWEDSEGELLEFVRRYNKLPSLSSTGIRDYIVSYLAKQTPKSELDKHIVRYTFDTGGKEKVFTARPEESSQNAS